MSITLLNNFLKIENGIKSSGWRLATYNGAVLIFTGLERRRRWDDRLKATSTAGGSENFSIKQDLPSSSWYLESEEELKTWTLHPLCFTGFFIIQVNVCMRIDSMKYNSVMCIVWTNRCCVCWRKWCKRRSFWSYRLHRLETAGENCTPFFVCIISIDYSVTFMIIVFFSEGFWNKLPL